MALNEQQILSKVLDEQNFFVLNRYNINEGDFTTELAVYDFIKGYVSEYKTTPDYRTVVAEFEHFEYYPEVHDTFPFLCKKLKDSTAKRLIFNTLQKEAVEKFPLLNGAKFVEWLKTEVDKVATIADTSSSMGTNFATNGAERLVSYEESKVKGTDIFIPTPYAKLTEYLEGGFELGDYILLMAYTNRGKSWIGSQIATNAWCVGNGVLYYSPELTKQQQVHRFDTLIGHFSNTGLRNGELGHDEARYANHLNRFNDENEVPFIVKTMEDLNKGLSLATIEADLSMLRDIKLVVIDGFNLMEHGGRDSNRNNMSNTSRKLRQLFGRHGVAGLVIHQTPTSAEKENRNTDELGTRIVEPPRLDQYSESVALIQDPCTILTFDQQDGMGAIKIVKARVPNVNKVVQLQCNFNFGFIDEVPETFDF